MNTDEDDEHRGKLGGGNAAERGEGVIKATEVGTLICANFRKRRRSRACGPRLIGEARGSGGEVR